MKFFTEHPASVGETYLEHLVVALGFGLKMTLGGLACIVHAFVPPLFVTTGSRAVRGLHQRMVTARGAKPLPFGTLDFVI